MTEVGEAQIAHGGGEVSTAHPASACFVPPERDASPILHMEEQGLDVVALGLQRGGLWRWSGHVAPWRGVDGAAAGRNGGAQCCRDAASVKSRVASRTARRQRGRVAQVRVLSGTCNQPQNPANVVGARMKLGAKPAAAAAKRLILGRAAGGAARRTLRLAWGAVDQQQPVHGQNRAQALEHQLPPAATHQRRQR